MIDAYLQHEADPQTHRIGCVTHVLPDAEKQLPDWVRDQRLMCINIALADL
jgi:hypothetical protein